MGGGLAVLNEEHIKGERSWNQQLSGDYIFVKVCRVFIDT